MRKYYFILTLVFLWCGYILSSVYRPYAYQKEITDFGLADVANNIIFVPGVYFLILAIRNKPLVSYFYDIVLIWSIYISIELLQYVDLVPGTFDWADISGLTLGAVLAVVLNNVLKKVRQFI